MDIMPRGVELRCTAVVIWGDQETLTPTLAERSSKRPATPKGAEEILGPVIHAI